MVKAPEPLDPSVWHPELLADALRSKRLTVLCAPTGALRDGMVRRGLMPLLRQGLPDAGALPLRRQVAVHFEGWGPLPLEALRARIDSEFSAAWPHGPPETLAAHLHAIGRRHQATVLLVLDAFERHLDEPAKRPDIERFDNELSECISQGAVLLHVLIVVDDPKDRARQRYAHRIANFGDHVLRLPSPMPDPADGTPWCDTDIEVPPGGDDSAPPESDADWSVDVPVDLPVPAPPAAATNAVPPPAAEAPTPDPTPLPLSLFDALDDAATEGAGDIAADAGGARRRDAGLPGECPEAGPPDAEPPSLLAAAPTTSLQPAPAVAASASRPAPPWLSEADLEEIRRSQERASRWPARLGLVLYLAVLLALAWWAARWITDSEPATTPARALEQPAAVPAAPAAAPVGASAASPVAAAPAAVPALALALPRDAGSAAAMLDELVRRVAVPAGLRLHSAVNGEPPTLALMRADALRAAHGAGGVPLQVVAPLYSERVQVLVRTDSRWDFIREIKEMRLNIGPADGARAHTARALYEQLFGTPLAAAQADALELDAALRALVRRNPPFDAVIAVSDELVEPQLPPDAQRQVRELEIDTRHPRAATLQTFSITHGSPRERARLSTTTYLVAPGIPPRAHDAALRALAAALCRAQPTLQAQGSPLLRGLHQGQQPDVGWSYVLPRTPDRACPQP